jgi:hypothetical protein
VRVVVERARPRLQDGQNANLPADPRAIGRQGLDGGRGFLEERRVDHVLVRAGERAQFLGQGKGEEVVVAGEQARADAGEPLLGAILLTLGTVAVATRMICVVQGATRITLIDRAAEGRRAAPHDIVHRVLVRRQQPAGVGRAIRRPRRSEDVPARAWARQRPRRND